MTELVTGEDYPVRARCPACGDEGLLSLELATRLVMIEGEASRLSVRAKGTRVRHVCGQLSIDDAIAEHVTQATARDA